MKESLLQLTRFAAFRRVLADALQTARADLAKRRPTSPAYAAHKAATTDAERRAAYAAFTRADRDARDADLHSFLATSQDARLIECRADEARRKACNDAAIAAAKVAENARLATLLPGARSRAEFVRVSERIAKFLGYCYIVPCYVLKFAQAIAAFVALYLFVAILAAPFLLIHVIHSWRETIAIVKAFPSAVRAFGAKR